MVVVVVVVQVGLRFVTYNQPAKQISSSRLNDGKLLRFCEVLRNRILAILLGGSVARDACRYATGYVFKVGLFERRFNCRRWLDHSGFFQELI